MNAIYPGSFDPITLGHLDIIQRSAKLVDRLYIGVLINNKKKGFLSIEERVELIKCSTKHLNNVEIISFDGLLVELFDKLDIHFIVKGLRAVTDFEFELQMAQLNHSLDNRAETLFMMSNPKYTFLSSSIVRELYRFNGNFSDYVPECVNKKLNIKMEGK